MARPPDWRDRAAVELAAGAVRRLSPAGRRVLIYEEPSTVLDDVLVAAGARVERWNRRAVGGREAAIEPPPGPFDLAFLRLPRSKHELEMAAEMVAGVAAPDARLLVYGAKDEGIGSAPTRVERVFPSGPTLAVGGHCRIWSLSREGGASDARGRLSDWGSTFDPGLPGLSDGWVSFPGVFAHGELDPGTRLLAESLAGVPPAERVLDFGCGSGVLGALECLKQDAPQVDLLDVDTVALAAAARNVPGGRTVLHDGLPTGVAGPYDRIVTNPAIHTGKAETRAIVERMVLAAPSVLTRKGSLWMVIQKRFAPRPLLSAAFRDVRLRAESPVFGVWEARRPKPGKAQ